MSIADPKLYLDDGTGTYPTDISSRLKLDSIEVSGYGRTDEFTQSTAAMLSVTLDNADGRFTNGTVSIEPGTPVRLVETVGATTKNRFTGTVATLALGWPSGGQEFSVVTLTAVDLLADLSRYDLRSMLEQEILLDGPAAYYTLGEAEGSTSAGDTSGNGSTPLTIQGSGAPPTFGSGTGPVDGLSAVTFAGGQYLSGRGTVPLIGATSGITLEGFMATTETPTAARQIAAVSNPDSVIRDEIGIYLNTDGTVGGGLGVTNGTNLVLASSAATANDGKTHQVALKLVISGGNVTATIYLDGAPTVGTTAALASFPTDFDWIDAGGSQNWINGDTHFNGTISHVALYGTALSDARIASHAGVLTGFVESTAARFARIAFYAGVASVSTPVNSGTLVATQATTGQSALDALQAVADAETGVMFANGSGSLILQGAGYRAQKTTATLSLGEQEPAPDTSITWDTQQLVNQVTVTRTGGATQVIPTTPIPRIFPQSLDLIVTTDDIALSRAQWLLGKHQTTSPRLPGATFDLMTSPSAASILSLEIGDRLNLSALPSQVWPASGDYTIEGWSETRSTTSWTITFNLLPWSLFQAAIWDVTNWDDPAAVWGP